MKLKKVPDIRGTRQPLESTGSNTELNKLTKSDYKRVFLHNRPKKEYNVKPTERQKRAFKNLTEKACSKREAMKDAGYGENVQNKPKTITETKGWKQLLEKYLPDDDLAAKHKELLNAKEIKVINFNMGVEDDLIRENMEETGHKVVKIAVSPSTGKKLCFYFCDNTVARDKALDKAYKMKGFYNEDHKHTLTIEEVMAKAILDDDEEDDY